MLVTPLLLTAVLGCAPEPHGGGRKEPVEPTEPTTKPTEPTEPTEPVVLPEVVINEVVPGNDSTLNGPDGVSRPDWIELLNLGSGPVDLGTLTLRDGDGSLWTGPAGVELGPGERYLVYADAPADDSTAWTGWPIDKDGDKLTLLFAEQVVDFLKIEEVDQDIAWARVPDGTGEFVATAWTTPGEPNGDDASPTLQVADETMFTDRLVHQIHFTIDLAVGAALNDPARPEVPVAMEIDGVAYPEVGLKLKGSASYDTMAGKPAFIVDLNEYVPGERFRGLKKFKLHNGLVLDPTRVRDWLTYKLAREAGVMAPRVGWAEVYCNGEYYGIYVVIEAHDDEMIEYWYPESKDSGMIFEPNESQGPGWGWGDFGVGNMAWNYETGPVPPDELGVDSLREADRIFGGPATDAAVAELWSYVDQENFLTYLAWEAVVAHTDGYMAPNNWRVYVDGVTHKVHWVPSGAEWTWDNYAGVWYFGGNAGSWCLENQGCRYEYAQHVLTVAQLAEDLMLQDEFLALSAWLDPIIAIDPRYQSSWGGDLASTRQDTFQNLARFPADARAEVLSQYPDLAP